MTPLLAGFPVRYVAAYWRVEARTEYGQTLVHRWVPAFDVGRLKSALERDPGVGEVRVTAENVEAPAL